MSETFKVFRHTSLPGTLEPYAIYFIAPSTSPDLVEVYVTGSTGSIVKRVLKESDVQTLIDDSIASLSSINVVNDITTRNALNPSANQIVLVLDASDDATVNSGAATYVYRLSTTTWIKISEYESMDLVINWTDIQGRPTSTVANIDDAVAKRHTHANKTELDKIGEDGGGNLTYSGALPVIAWNSVGW